MDELTKVLIVDDHKVMRDMLEREFCADNGYEVIGSLESAAATEAFCDMKRPDVIIMDVCTEFGASGLEAAEKILNRFPDIKIIMTSGFDEISYMPRAKEIGAHAFVHKTNGAEYYRDTAKCVLNGEYVFPAPQIIPLPRGETPFTDREMEVLRLMCKHMNSQKVADELFIEKKSVERHLDNMRQKAGFSRYAELLVYVLSNGWINPNY